MPVSKNRKGHKQISGRRKDRIRGFYSSYNKMIEKARQLQAGNASMASPNRSGETISDDLTNTLTNDIKTDVDEI